MKRFRVRLLSPLAAGALIAAMAAAFPAVPAPGAFKGRIAWSCDGNHNDEDDWAASPAALAIFAETGLKDKLVHFDYNNIVPKTDPAWEQEHEISILGAVKRYGYKPAVFIDCRKNMDAAVASIARAINASSADNPLYFVLAGPMEVPFLGIQKSNPAKRKFVYCISHSRWNDGYAGSYTFTNNKRSVIPTGIRWIQIQDQNPGLATGPFGRPHTPEEWAPWEWMRDSSVEPVRFLYERLRATKRADCSDAGMAYFVATGDEGASIEKLRNLIEKHERPVMINPRPSVRMEAENFLKLENYEVESTDRTASHRLNVRFAQGANKGRIAGPFDQPFTAKSGRYSVDVRYRAEAGASCSYAFSVNGSQKGSAWKSGDAAGWTTQTIPNVKVQQGSRLAVEAECYKGAGRLDYVELRLEP